MRQVAVVMIKMIKELLREKVALFWIIAWPILWVLMACVIFTRGLPEDVVQYARGSSTICMMTFALMIAGMTSIPGSIADDRERGLLSKLKSMPIRPWKDITGRILGLLVFSALAVILVALVGYACGARFSFTFVKIGQSFGFFLLILLTSAGIGMLVGTFIKNVQGAIMTGVGISVVTAAISGVMSPYSSLPPWLQQLARVYPISSANSSVLYLLANGEEAAGYNPLMGGRIALTMILSVAIFIVGIIIYSKLCWRRE